MSQSKARRDRVTVEVMWTMVTRLMLHGDRPLAETHRGLGALYVAHVAAGLVVESYAQTY